MLPVAILERRVIMETTTHKPNEMLSEFMMVISSFLPKEIEKKFSYKKEEAKFSFSLLFRREESMFQSKEVRTELQSLLYQLNGKTKYIKLANGSTEAHFEFEVTNEFLETIKKNIEAWGIMHPLKELSASFKNQIKI
jgi:hypothetical protein